MFTSHDQPPIPVEMVTAKKDTFRKMAKEIPELAEFMEGFLGPTSSISSECILEAGHKGPHHIVTTWIDPTKESK